MNVLVGFLILAAALPGFEDFRRADRERRLTGELQTAESVRLTHVDPDLVRRIAREHDQDPQIQWAAAELLADWPERRSFYVAAIERSGTNTAVVLRLASVAAWQQDPSAARPWLKHYQHRDPANLAAEVIEVWLTRSSPGANRPDFPEGQAPRFDDASADAARARIRLLEVAGYSQYAARRLGFLPEQPVLKMAQELSRSLPQEPARLFLTEVARVMQSKPTYLLTELIGQSLERALVGVSPDAAQSEAVARRMEQLIERRRELQTLTAEIGRETIEIATEEQLTSYYDDLLTLGEERALKRLRTAVRARPKGPVLPATP